MAAATAAMAAVTATVAAASTEVGQRHGQRGRRIAGIDTVMVLALGGFQIGKRGRHGAIRGSRSILLLIAVAQHLTSASMTNFLHGMASGRLDRCPRMIHRSPRGRGVNGGWFRLQ